MTPVLFMFYSRFSRQLSNYKPWYKADATEEENERAMKAFEAVLTVTASSSGDVEQYEKFAEEVKELSMSKFGYNYTEEVNSFVANFHDAVSIVDATKVPRE